MFLKPKYREGGSYPRPLTWLRRQTLPPFKGPITHFFLNVHRTNIQGLSFSLNIIFSKFNFSSWKGVLPEEGQRDEVIELKISNIKIIRKQHKKLRFFTGSILSRQGRFYCEKHSSLGLEPLRERSLCKYPGSKSKQTVWVLRAFCVGAPVFPVCFPPSGTFLSLGAPDHRPPPSLAPAAPLGFPGNQGPFFLSFIGPTATT